VLVDDVVLDGDGVLEVEVLLEGEMAFGGDVVSPGVVVVLVDVPVTVWGITLAVRNQLTRVFVDRHRPERG
jgi:hypothetical protein